MEKKLTLEQTWKYCLAMWKWIAEEIKQDNNLDIDNLKRKWLRKHLQFGKIKADCFFCQYANQHNFSDDNSICICCPGRLVNKRFDCSNKTYNYENEPVAFYHNIVGLNKKRKKLKQG